MIIAKILFKDRPSWVVVKDEDAFALDGDRFSNPKIGAKLGSLRDFKLLAPLDRTNNLINLLSNWGAKGDRDGPGFFVKISNSLRNPGEPVVYPRIAKRVHIEPELGIVLGKVCSDVSPADAGKFIMGYTVCNDVCAFEMEGTANASPEARYPDLIRGKYFDGFGHVGPWIVTEIDGDKLPLKGWVNDTLIVDINTEKMLWSTREVVSWISRVTTLYPGDVISCGAPPGIFTERVQPGDRMKVAIEGIGHLENRMVQS